MLWNFHDLFRLSVLLPMVVLSRVIVAVRIMPQQEINYKRNIDRCCLSWILIYITFIPHFQLGLTSQEANEICRARDADACQTFQCRYRTPGNEGGPCLIDGSCGPGFTPRCNTGNCEVSLWS